MSFDWKGFVGSVAPTLATALGGPMAGMAVKAIADGLGVQPNVDEVSKALASASPDTLLKLKQVDADFATKMKELDINLQELVYKDVDSARTREVNAHDSRTPQLLALFAVACFVGLVYGVLHGMDVATGMKDTFLILVGAAIAVFKDVYGYYFGSSSGSAEKSRLLADK